MAPSDSHEQLGLETAAQKDPEQAGGVQVGILVSTLQTKKKMQALVSESKSSPKSVIGQLGNLWQFISIQQALVSPSVK